MFSTIYTCERCGESYKSDYVKATGHKESGWIVDKEPTTEQDIVVAAAHAAILGHTLAGAGGIRHRGSLIEAMPQRVSVIGDKGAAAALAV